MIIFLEYSDWSLAQGYIAERENLVLLELLQTSKKYIERSVLISWADLESFWQDDLFGTTQTKATCFDIGGLELKPAAIDFLLKHDLRNVYFFSSIRDGLNNDEKKLWLKSELEYIQLKKVDEKIKSELVHQYLSALEIKIEPINIQKLLHIVQTYQEVIDIIDCIALSGNAGLLLKSLEFEDKPLPFMLGFDMRQLQQDAERWYHLITEDDLQLALSLIYTKLEKQGPQARSLMYDLIKTDERIKTRGGISPSVWWKLFLWKATQTN